MSHCNMGNGNKVVTPNIVVLSSNEIGNSNGVRAVNSVTSKTLAVNSSTLPHRDVHKHAWTSRATRWITF
jgi:hypothetical protein